MNRYALFAVFGGLALLAVFVLFFVAGAAAGLVFVAATSAALLGFGLYAWLRWGRRRAG